MKTIRISAKAARALAAEGCGNATCAAHDELDRALSALERKKQKRSPSLKLRAEKKKTKRGETSRIYEEVAKRAGGACECGCGRPFGEWLAAPQLDHQWGRGKVRQSVENCWLLTIFCHDAKTRNILTRREWLEKFRDHARLYGYASQVAKANAEIEAEAISVSLPASPIRAPAAPGGGRP